VRPTASPVAAALGLAWLGSFLPPALPALAAARWPSEWARHLAGGWPGTAGVVQYALGWLIAGALLRALPGAARAWRMLALAAGAVLALRFTWFASYAGNAEAAGAAIALAVWPAAERLPGAWLERLLAAATAAAVLYAHLAPHGGGAHVHGLHWVPFTDLVGAGGAGLHVALLCGKLFWYGALVWLLAAAGLRAWTAGLAVAAALLLVEVVRLGSAGAVQYATTTDPAIALAVGLAIALLARGSAAR
jgi:hypothetical protein